MNAKNKYTLVGMSLKTAGPWAWLTTSPDVIQIVTTNKDDEPNGRIAVIERVAWCNDGEEIANARLIAAAPDLLEALRYTNQDTDNEGCFCNCPLADGTRPDNHHATSYVVARAAIAKAQGETVREG